MNKIILSLRNPKVWQTIVAIVIFAIISLAFFHPDATDGNVLRQHDMMQGAAIGHETEQYQSQTGEKSWWTNSLFGGMPTYQISPTYASNSLIDWITTVYGLGLPSPANLLFMMMLGFFILMLAMNVKWQYGLIGAVAWGFSSYFIIIIGAGHIWKFVTLAYIPPTIAGVILAYNGRLLRGGALTALFGAMQIASNHIQMSYYFCFVMFAIAVGYFITLYKSKNLKLWNKATGVLLIAGILAVGANLPSLYNTYSYSKNTMRGQHSELSSDTPSEEATDGLDRDYITQYSYGRSETFSLLIPNIRGGASARPEKGEMVAMTLSKLPDATSQNENVNQYLEYVSQYFGEPEGTNGPVYVGVIIFALFLLGCITVRGSLKWVLVVMTVLSLLLAMGRNCQWLTDLFIDYFPMYSKFRTVESILVIAEFTIPLLGILALQNYFDKPEKNLRPLYISFGIVALFCVAALLFPTLYGPMITQQDEEISRMITKQLAAQGGSSSIVRSFSLDNPAIYQAIVSLRSSMVESDALRSLCFLGLAFIFMLSFSKKWVKAPVAIAVIGVAVLVDLFNVDKRYLSHDSFCTPQITLSEPFPLTPADRAILADTAMNYRVLDVRQFFQAAPSYHHKAVGGYHAAKLTRYQDLIDRHLINLVYGQPSEADIRVANMLNSKYIVYDTDRVAQNPDAAGNAWFANTLTFVDNPDREMEALAVIDPTVDAVADKKFSNVLSQPSVPVPGDTIFETSYAPNRLTYHYDSRNGGLAVLSEIYYPDGWIADVDGKEVEIGRVNYVLRAVNVPAGSHTLTLRFEPRSVSATTTVAFISIILIFIACIASIAFALNMRKKDA